MTWNRTTAILSIVALSVAVYANSLLNGFALDDVFIVQQNARVHNLGDLAGIWLTPYWTSSGVELGLYRPGIIFLYALQWHAGDGAPWVFHAVNVAGHAAVGVLVFALLLRLSSLGPALIGALVFAVHPLHTEAVANVVGQAEIFAAGAVLCACVVHAYRPHGLHISWSRRWVLVLAFACAIVMKESSVVLPALLVLIDVAQRRVAMTRKDLAEYARALAVPMFLLAATLATYLLVRMDVLGGTIIGLDAAPAMPYLREEHRVLNAFRALPEFYRLLLFPIDLAADYAPAALLPVDSVRPMVVLGAALLAVTIMIACAVPKWPRAGFCAAWFLIAIITISNLLFPIGVVLAERTLYLPSVAIAAIAAFAWQRVAKAQRRVVVTARVCAAIVIVLFGIRTWIRNPEWKNTNAVWTALIRDQPASYRTQWIIAARFVAAKRLDDAEERFELARQLYDRDPYMAQQHADLLTMRRRFDDAIHVLEEASIAHGRFNAVTPSLLHAYLGAGRYEDAIAAADRGLSDGVPPAAAFPVRAFALHQLGRFDEAAASWRIAARHSPQLAWHLSGFAARALASAGWLEQARTEARDAVAIAPDEASAAVLMGIVEAVDTGCYAREAAIMLADGPASPSQPIGARCDDLRHGFPFLAPMQNATMPQNASGPDPEA